ncbi:MAG: hypothetical protein KF874_12650 [Rhizobiaceae bacterium]|nr:hypothetical protein [Rhizobiaceae bacterium]
MRVSCRKPKIFQPRPLADAWSLKGNVNWTAPRVLALSFTPILAVAVLFAVSSRTGGDAFALAVIGIVFVAAHLLHIWLIDRQK